ncbi:hypothetical protein CAEBREN_30113 [Caenorhabditis brenneri]|uniref:Uncharacterized protein n=1 Tax=Caenorhabditis brenneri TaxID=135651 RepID=G0NE22_CAEBE|nr:hypothetical protein CAEBREN_30113 [Caenorhabditis brenneri]
MWSSGPRQRHQRKAEKKK